MRELTFFMNANVQRVCRIRLRCSGSSPDDCIRTRTRASFSQFLSQFVLFVSTLWTFVVLGAGFIFASSKSDILCDPTKLWNCSVPFDKSAPLISVHAVNHPQHSISYERTHNVC